MRRFTRRPSPAMLVALVALGVALSGNAVADGVNAVIAKLSPNSVTGSTVKNGSLTAKDFKKTEIAKLKGKAGVVGPAGAAGAAGPGGPTGPAGTPNGYTKTEADAAFLGKTAKAADADKVDGIDSSGLIQGSGALGSNYALQSAGANDTSFFAIPQLGKIEASCAAGGVYALKYTNDSGATVRYTTAITDVSTNSSTADDTSGTSDQATNGSTVTLTSGGSDLRTYDLRFQRTTGILFFTTYTGTIHMVADGAPTGDPTKCKFQGEIQSATTASGGFIFLPFAHQK